MHLREDHCPQAGHCFGQEQRLEGGGGGGGMPCGRFQGDLGRRTVTLPAVEYGQVPAGAQPGIIAINVVATYMNINARMFTQVWAEVTLR